MMIVERNLPVLDIGYWFAKTHEYGKKFYPPEGLFKLPI